MVKNIFVILGVIYFTISGLTRLGLSVLESRIEHFNTIHYLRIFTNGLINDLATFLYLLPVLLIFIALIHLTKKYRSILLRVFLFLFISFSIFITVAEVLFWQEFSSRFNFIAVDYLIYTQEVLGNIQESFNLPLILTAVVLASIGLSIILEFCIKTYNISLQRIKPFDVSVIVLLSLIVFFLPKVPNLSSSSALEDELGKNGLYQLFYAFGHNQIDFLKLYKTLPKSTVLSIYQKSADETNTTLQLTKSDIFIKHHLSPISAPKNLIFIVVESLGSEFLEFAGNTKNIAPYLNHLTNDSLFFENIYATGTRTVRGIEALTLSIPPTPGASIVRREHNENLFSMGSILYHQNYDTKFIYGGYGLFDNMNYFFSNNSFQIVDRQNFTKDEITFANIWGVCDEDLFAKTLKESDKSFNEQKNFFSFVLTTSNHRPFTYPEGRIDIPSKSGRDGGVKYTDFAINNFLTQAKSKPWFKDTIFVIIGDHGAHSRGKLDIPVASYHIPFFIYAPHVVQPKKVHTVASQIDVIPTILNLMQISYDSKFFGKDILAMKKPDERFFSGTYQKVGYYKDGYFIQLGPKKEVKVYTYDTVKRQAGDEIQTYDSKIQSLIDEAITYYQYAYHLFTNQLYSYKSI